MQQEIHAVRFLQQWRGRTVGHIDTQLDFGVMDQLVRRNIAEWQRDDEPDRPKRRKNRE